MSELRQLLRDFIVEVRHVGFVVEDIKVAVADACRVYGVSPDEVDYQPAPGVDAPTRFAFFQVGGLEFEYIQPCSEQFRALLLDMPSGGAGINHLAWRVVDIHGALAVLAARGIRAGHVTPDGVVEIGAKKMVYLDPATTGGLVIELLEYPIEESRDST